MADRLPGMKIRRLRRQAGLTQKDLAKRAGISPSYLNLIERNRRAVAGVLLHRLAAALGVDRAAITNETERHSVETLKEIATDEAIADNALDLDEAEALVALHPRWANLIARLHRAYVERTASVMALADRLGRNPFLNDSVHRILTHATSIHSASEILKDIDTKDVESARRFLSIVIADSGRLSESVRALSEFLASTKIRVDSATPMEHVDAFIYEADNHFAVLEALAGEFRAEAASKGDLDAMAERFLEDGSAHEDGAWTVPKATDRFRRIRQAAQRYAGQTVDAILDGRPVLASAEARALAASALHAYFAGAVLMPYEPFLEAAERYRYDIDLLTRRFEVSFEQAAHRLATLRRPGMEGVRFAFMRADPSGHVTKRLPLPDLPMPRFGSACPLWAIYAAFQSPGATVARFGGLASGAEFLFVARAVDKQPSASRPRRLLSIMLVCQAEMSDRVVYADGLDRAGATGKVGVMCRLCPRSDCGHRQEAPLVA